MLRVSIFHTGRYRGFAEPTIGDGGLQMMNRRHFDRWRRP
jgi:hypothetical protein